MRADLVRVAADQLNILGLHLWSSQTRVVDDFNPRIDLGPVIVNLQWGPRRTAVLSFEKGDGSPGRGWNVWFGTEARVLKNLESVDEHGNVNQEGPEIASLKAEFLMQYEFVSVEWPLNHDALHEFAQHNTPIHVWPYWREWLQTTAMRMGLPPVIVPLQMHMLPPSKDIDAPPVVQTIEGSSK